jgi:hypothetical protein
MLVRGTLIGLIFLVMAIGIWFYPDTISQDIERLRYTEMQYERIDSAYDQAIASVDAQMLSERLGVLIEALDGYEDGMVNAVEYENLVSLRRQADELANAGIASTEFQAVLQHIPWQLAHRSEDPDLAIGMLRVLAAVLFSIGLSLLRRVAFLVSRTETLSRKRKNDSEQRIKTYDGEELLVIEADRQEVKLRSK